MLKTSYNKETIRIIKEQIPLAKKDDKNIVDDEILDSIVYDDNDTELDQLPDDAKKAEDDVSSADEIDITEESDENLKQDEKESTKKIETVIDIFKKNDYRFLKISLGIAAILVVVAGMISYYFIADRNQRYNNLLNVDYFYEGVYIDNISVGGYSKEEAIEAVTQANEIRLGKVGVSLVWDDEKIIFDNENIDISFNTSSVIDSAWEIGRSGKENKRYDYVIELIDNPVHFDTQMEVDPSNIEAKIKAAVLFRERDPGEAAVAFNPDPELEGSEWFVYSEPVVGIKTDPIALWTSVEKAIIDGDYSEIEIPKEEIAPTITIDDLMQKTQLLVQFKSHMVRSSNREHNVRLACSQINGTVLMPGEEFSMNETTGKRTKAAGYKEAKIIVGGNQLVPGIAGGVCQVSGTLFNAIVRADLEIIERHHHSFELSYLTRGRDATVNYGTADLRFKNISDSPMYISMYTIDRDVYAEIYGVPLADGMRIGMDVKTTKTEQPGPKINVADSDVSVANSPMIVSSRTGIRCTTYKVYYDKDGKIVEKIPLYSDYYKPFAEEYHYNPAVMP